MKIFVVNAGSSSLKYQLIDMDDKSVIVKGLCERIGIDGIIKLQKPDGSKFEAEYDMPDHTTAFKKVIEWMTSGETKVIDDLGEISAAGHRIVQGGACFKESCIIDDVALEKIADYGKLAPLHNPAHVQGIKACIEVLGKDVPQVAVFDTSFHSTMPEEAYIFPLPYEYYEKYDVRRYGAHGTSHRYISGRLINECGIGTPSKVITCHLGNGSSITAVKDGKCIDTSMGLTPLDGFMMGTRCGAVDPSAITYIMDKENLTPKQMDEIMNKKSGYLGVSGVSSDNRDVIAAAEEGNKRAILARKILKYQIRKVVGSYIAALGGVDAIAFTGGLGENDADIREAVCEGLEFVGLKLDKEKNNAARFGNEGIISTEDSKVKAYVLLTDEEMVIAKDTQEIVEKLK
ncbi:MAG: acetate kinase [Clostridia bacterium]|nr:acetate kinase [Clostridia bacterium]